MPSSPPSADAASPTGGIRHGWSRWAWILPGGGEQLGAPLWMLFWTRVLNGLAFSSAFPFLAGYLARERGLAASTVGALYMAQGLVGATAQLVGGDLADRWGRRRILVWSLGARALVCLGIFGALRAQFPVSAVTALILTNALLAGFFIPAADALVTDLAPPGRRMAAFAHQRVAINVGWAAGPVIGGAVQAWGSFSTQFLLAAPAIGLAAWAFSRIEAPPVSVDTARTRPWEALTAAWNDTGLRRQLAGAFLIFAVAGQLVVTLQTEAAHRLHLSPERIGLLWTVNGLMVVTLQMPVSQLVRRWGGSRALVAGALLYAVGYSAVGWAPSYGALLACLVVVTLGELLNAPAQQDAVAARGATHGAGRVLGLLGLVTMLGRSLGPWIGGVAQDWSGGRPAVAWGAIGSLALVSAWLQRPGRRADEVSGGPDPGRPAV